MSKVLGVAFLTFVCLAGVGIAGCEDETEGPRGMTPRGSASSGGQGVRGGGGKGGRGGGGGTVTDAGLPGTGDDGGGGNANGCLPAAAIGSGHHNAGADCLQCHDSNQMAPNLRWTIAGTLFASVGGGVST